jgi:hypothetical protein
MVSKVCLCSCLLRSALYNSIICTHISGESSVINHTLKASFSEGQSYVEYLEKGLAKFFVESCSKYFKFVGYMVSEATQLQNSCHSLKVALDNM